jgi:hypothetical protein
MGLPILMQCPGIYMDDLRKIIGSLIILSEGECVLLLEVISVYEYDCRLGVWPQHPRKI